MIKDQSDKLRLLPPVHELVAEFVSDSEICKKYSRQTVTWAVRTALAKARDLIKQKNQDFLDLPIDDFAGELRKWLRRQVIEEMTGNANTLKRVINATGVVLHTNCGRAPLADEVVEHMLKLATGYSNLELDIRTGKRGSRYDHIQDLLTELTGAEAALVVNNNAAAVLLIMNTLANGKEVIVSRGELVEVGGSFRIPEVLKAGGAKLVEVGATNKTWLRDYREAITAETALILKVHTSNYRIEGFHHAVDVQELAQLGAEFGIPVVEDLGSGSFLDGTDLGLPKEPTVQEAVKSGATLVTFSGDKLLGGPQAGIILGKRELIEKLKKNHLTRALRVDKITISALAATLDLYRKQEYHKIPIWRMLSKTKDELYIEAKNLQGLLQDVTTVKVEIDHGLSCVGGGAFPTATLPSVLCTVQPLESSVTELEEFLRYGEIPILARIVKDKLVFDPRTLLPGDAEIIAARLKEW